MPVDLYINIYKNCEIPFINKLNTIYKNKYEFTHSTQYDDMYHHIDCYCKNLNNNEISTIDFKFLGYMPNSNANYIDKNNNVTIYAELYNKNNKPLSLYGDAKYLWYIIKNYNKSYIIDREELKNYIDTNKLKINENLNSGNKLVYFKIIDLPKHIYKEVSIIL